MTDRLVTANAALSTFAEAELYYYGNELRMRWQSCGKQHHYPAHLRGCGRWLRHGHNHFPGGGTAEQCLCQLVRWLRGLSRYPLRCWEHWCGPTVALGGDATLSLLRNSDYDARIACVLCGSGEYRGGVDWWSLGEGKAKIEGPACWMGRCRKEG